MAVGWYSPSTFESAISPWTTLGPLAMVIFLSLLQEGFADWSRHKSDSTTNNFPCIVLQRADDLDEEDGTRAENIRGGKDIEVNLNKNYYSELQSPRPGMSSSTNTCDVAFASVKRQDIRQGSLVMVRNREMVPADVIMLASSSDNGNAYIETSSIDGETNLKLRTSPQLPKTILNAIREEPESADEPVFRETLEQATKRITRMSALAYPEGMSATDNPANPVKVGEAESAEMPAPVSGLRLKERMRQSAQRVRRASSRGFGNNTEDRNGGREHFVMALNSEPPNASVNTYSGVLVMPPVQADGPSVEVPLNADNILLRGAVLRNTEWVIGLTCFTGKDTKLVRNSFETPSKFSRLDILMNRIVICILTIMVLCISYLATFSVFTTDERFDQLWYIRLNKNLTQPWPYLPDLDPPAWTENAQNWWQVFFLFVTLCNNFVPLSLYVTVEVCTLMLRIFINFDINMYDPISDTRTVARSTTVTDLGQVEYVFSDKTGTLTQNVMRFKRCSVDGLVFGAPVEKSSPDAKEEDKMPFHPLKRLLLGKSTPLSKSSRSTEIPTIPGKPSFMAGRTVRHSSGGLQSLGPARTSQELAAGDGSPPETLTFNAEMFLRVMSLCHTVVVEQDYDANPGVVEATSAAVETNSGSIGTTFRQFVFGKKETSSGASETPAAEKEAVVEEEAPGSAPQPDDNKEELPRGKDGAPSGFAYQAESPDEGALVQAASLKFNFQVVGRDSLGIKLACMSPSVLADSEVQQGLKDGSLTAKALAAKTAATDDSDSINDEIDPDDRRLHGDVRLENWTVLAINKFDSTRKRMSILVRSPEEYGSIPMVLCKGADSAMLEPSVLHKSDYLMKGDEDADAIREKSQTQHDEDGEEDWDRSNILGLQSHLGEFAREGLRTLVLAVRVLTETECKNWMEEYTVASTSIKDRGAKLTKAAQNIECGLHIVGATAIEDKLQVGVPDTIANLNRAGIKLWVLTGDKRETAKEIGYATKVLTAKMRPNLTEVAKGPKEEVRTKMAMQFLKLVKFAKLPEYQTDAVDEKNEKTSEKVLFALGKMMRAFSRARRRFFHKYIKPIFMYCSSEVLKVDPALEKIDQEEKDEEHLLRVTVRRRNVRRRADKIVRDFLQTEEGQKQRQQRQRVVAEVETGTDDVQGFSIEDLTMEDTRPLDTFSRADSARKVMSQRRLQGHTSGSEKRDLTLANVTAHEALTGEGPLVDEEILSMKSHLPTAGEEAKRDFDKKKRTLLEKVFAVDGAVRHGRLKKHLRKEKLLAISEQDEFTDERQKGDVDDGPADGASDGPRGLVIEGAALEQLLGDPELEELLFAVASVCDSVIACRVSPAQKAQLVQLVRRYVVPEPVTLAIGDGANDVGMIQEAHVGIGISGKEGQQAVNASDFAIAQFRFLEDLLLVHGRWSFYRLSIVVLYSFYKNAVMAGILIAFSGSNLYSGAALFDEWLIAMLNFVAAIPIGALGLFDRCLDREYVKKHPEVYQATRRNEIMTIRVIIRWILFVCIHIFVIMYLTVWSLGINGGGSTPAFMGLMSNDDPDRPGDGEGGDLGSVGTVAFTCLVITLSFKVRPERSVVCLYTHDRMLLPLLLLLLKGCFVLLSPTDSLPYLLVVMVIVVTYLRVQVIVESRSIIIGQWPACTCRESVGEGWLNRLAYTWIAHAYFSIGFYLFAIYVYMLLGRAGPSSFSPFVDTTLHVLHTRTLNWMVIIIVPITCIVIDVFLKVYSNLFFPTQTQIHFEIFAKEVRERKPPGRHNGSFPTERRRVETA